ncbi:T9SS type A sorting domain-containing protein, partial [bacterium]|nr:T9SS type A sorting domain-containing protein [bacterium]
SVFKISGNYPNPFNPKTTINFSVEYAAEVDLSIYSLSGKLVRQFQLGALTSGSQSIVWEGKDNFGNDVPSGVYIYRFQSESHSEARKMTLLK